MAYRVLVIPVQMIGQTVNRVSFPTLSRIAEDRAQVSALTLRISELLAAAAVPPMVFAAVSAPELVRLVLGTEWDGAIPVLTILAIAGARETALQATHSLMRAKGAGKLILRYEIGATTCQLVGIVIGLNWGIVGVAIGFTAAGFALTPVLMLIQRRLAGLSVRKQLGALMPWIHSSAWGAAAYLLVRLLGWPESATLLVGAIVYLSTGFAILRTFHRSSWNRLVRRKLLPSKVEL
jgi:PST family polysaccharide transporter